LRRLVVGALAIASFIACGPSAPGAKQEATRLQPTHVEGPPGVTLEMACTPTGPELCFNAIDDNCNGVFDEGCGVATGIIQFTVAWGDNAADVDLELLGPKHEKISDAARSTPDGFHLDRDCPTDNACRDQNLENIYFDGLEPPRGRYAVDVRIADLHGADVPVKIRFGARVGGRTFGADVELSHDDEKKSFSFDL
jgi:hypothetical protein